MATIIASTIGAARRSHGFSQRALAQAAGTTHQAVSAIENGRMQPSVGIALALARALGATVEELFGAAREPAPSPARTAVATIAGRNVTHQLTDEYLAMEPAASAIPPVFLAGCDLSVGLLARHATARSRDVRVLWLTMTNRAARRALLRGDVHAAVVHGAVGSRYQRRMAEFAAFEIATTQAGWLVQRGNPLGIRGPAEIARQHVRLVNRPPGAGARALLDEQLVEAGIDGRRLTGYGRELNGQLDAARAIAQGFADTAIGMASAASVFDLELVAVREERCTLIVAPSALQTIEVRALIDALRSTPYRRDLEAHNVYTVARTGERIA